MHMHDYNNIHRYEATVTKSSKIGLIGCMFPNNIYTCLTPLFHSGNKSHYEFLRKLVLSILERAFKSLDGVRTVLRVAFSILRAFQTMLCRFEVWTFGWPNIANILIYRKSSII